MKLDRELLQETIENFIASISSQREEEWYATPAELAAEFLDKFVAYTYKDEDDKRLRHAQYIELKKEFE